MTMTARKRTKAQVGHPLPRIGPPVPARTLVKEFEAAALDIGIELMPWQQYVGRFAYAIGPGDRWLYPEVAAVVSRQNGKTEFVIPHIMRRLAMGRRMLHAAQTREIPRLTFKRLVPLVEKRWPFAVIRRGAGQETIEVPLDDGRVGLYRISAATGGGPRGMSVDDLIVDELREIDEDFIGAALPTMAASVNPQVLYLSNAGEESSAALNAVKRRAGDDPSLAYLEWSASPERKSDDVTGWLEANPAIGHLPGLLSSVERAYLSHKLSGNLATFETEHLCRWVVTMRKLLVDVDLWMPRKAPVGKPIRPSLAVSMDPAGKRASVAIAWTDGTNVALKLLYDVTGDPIDTDRLGSEVAQTALKLGATVGYDPYTDAELVKYLTKTESINGGKYANASAQFVNLITAGKLRWDDADAVTDDLAWTARKDTGEASYHAVRLDDDRPITAVLAAVRAVWLASGPKPALPRVM